MKILLTGVTGFVGQYLFKSLCKTNNELVLLLRNEEKINQFTASELSAHTAIYLSDAAGWKQKVKAAAPEMVIHLAAYLTSADDEQSINKLLDSNIIFSTHLLDALKETRVKYFINTGTFAEYKNDELNPAYLYAATKTAFRSVLQYYSNIIGFKIVNIIPYSIYGGVSTNKKLIDLVYDSIGNTLPVDMSPGDQVLDLIHIDDVVNFYITLVKNTAVLKEKYYDCYLGTGKGTTPKQLAQLMETVVQKKTNINWGGKPYRPNDTMYAVAPKCTLMKNLQWKTSIALEEGVKKYYNDNKNNGI